MQQAIPQINSINFLPGKLYVKRRWHQCEAGCDLQTTGLFRFGLAIHTPTLYGLKDIIPAKWSLMLRIGLLRHLDSIPSIQLSSPGMLPMNSITTFHHHGNS
jgi:hypothetical protein